MNQPSNGGSQQQAGWAALQWSAEKPRAEGWWWLRIFEDERTATILHVSWIGSKLRVKLMDGLYAVEDERLKHWSAEWAGPINPPQASDAATPPNDEALRPADEGGSNGR